MNTENNLVLALLAIETIAVETVSIGKSIDAINERIAVIKGLGYHSIQSGLGNKPPVAGELPYKAYKEAITGKFEGKTGRLLTEAIRDLRASINHGLESGKTITDSNPSRVKSDKKEKTSRCAVPPKPFDALKVSISLCDKYTHKQINALITELQKLIS